MGLLSRLFKKSQTEEISVQQHTDSEERKRFDAEWELLPGYVDATTEEIALVSVISTAVAAGDNPESQFAVKQVKQRNPEVVGVSIIAASVIAQAMESQMVVRRIYRKKN